MNSVPLADQITEQGAMMDFGIAFSLLSKPTQTFTDEELLMVANDLRAKRVKFLAGQADRPGKTALAKKPKLTDEEKEAKTGHLKNLLSGAKLVFD